MKKLLKITVLLFTITMSSQHYGSRWGQRDKEYYGFVSTGFDIRNLTIGSNPTDNKSALDVQFKVGARANALEVAGFYESFKRIEFEAYGVNINGVFQLYKNFDVALGGEFGSVIKEGNSNYIMYGLNSELRYDLGKFILALQLNNRNRKDLMKYGNDFPIVHSVFFNLTYKLN